jgi:DNA-binding transcriptional MerR regulator
MNHTHELLMASEAARLLGMSPENVRLLERKGRLRAKKTPSGIRLFMRRDVERLARERQAKQQARAR